jgi:two-component system, OmpR family, KDP operon response regulator KdpE
VLFANGHSPRVLACDDEPQVLRALTVILRAEGCQVVTAADGAAALAAVAVTPVDGAVIDLVLPGMDGVELCRGLREHSDVPIIVLSAVDEEAQKIRALEAGADDYMTKPFSPRELVARLQAVLRRAGTASRETVLSADGLEIDLAAHVVRRDGQEIHLTRIEYDLLAVMVRNQGRLLTHHALLTAVWGRRDDADTQVLRTHVARLRRKIEPAVPPGCHYIHTESGIGFRFDPR